MKVSVHGAVALFFYAVSAGFVSGLIWVGLSALSNLVGG